MKLFVVVLLVACAVFAEDEEHKKCPCEKGNLDQLTNYNEMSIAKIGDECKEEAKSADYTNLMAKVNTTVQNYLKLGGTECCNLLKPSIQEANECKDAIKNYGDKYPDNECIKKYAGSSYERIEKLLKFECKKEE